MLYCNNKDDISYKDDITGPKPAWYSALNGIRFAQEKMGIYNLDFAVIISEKDDKIRTSTAIPILLMERNND